MEKRVVFTAMIALMIILSPEVKSQQIKVNVKGKVVQQADSRANQRTDQAISYGFDKLEQGIAKGVKGILGKKNKTGSEAEAEPDTVSNKTDVNNGNQQEPAAETPQEQSTLSWNKYDFVPGDEVIFEDNLQGEENGEFPSRWDLYRGNVEIAELDGEKVIMMRSGQPTIAPYFKDPKEDHLPDIFTVELDLYYPGSGAFDIYLYDTKNQESGSPSGYTDLEVYHGGNELVLGTARSKYPGKAEDIKGWMHISIAYTDGKLKAYMDDTRLINIPRLDFNPKGITLYTYHASDENLFYVKNVRIAKGGVKYYDRVMQDGKIIVNGIRFDTGKATLKPESMGPINEIFKLMKDNPDLKFSVEGHTDSQGDDAFNMKLSEDRANTVRTTLIHMGISADRLTSKGWGESKPISSNASPEDMANNRRVEFVKI
jgi:outer membrane protein OmpA-like peptidoglycan-associated protein